MSISVLTRTIEDLVRLDSAPCGFCHHGTTGCDDTVRSVRAGCAHPEPGKHVIEVAIANLQQIGVVTEAQAKEFRGRFNSSQGDLIVLDFRHAIGVSLNTVTRGRDSSAMMNPIPQQTGIIRGRLGIVSDLLDIAEDALGKLETANMDTHS